MLALLVPFFALLSWTRQARSQDQIPILTKHDDSFIQKDITIDETVNNWRFNFSSPAPYVFSSVHGLLQQWPNTFFPNGHSIVPCQIPAFTSLYHGRQDGDLPESPEWFAFDIEMSYGIMGSGRNSHILTYQTTRPVGCLYFDGESATLMGAGRMDTQMLFIYGNVTGPQRDDGRRFRGLEDEYGRASGLCQWIQEKKLGGPGWGIEGIVRMNAGFEMIWCNFTSTSIRLLTKVNVTVPLLLPADDNVGAFADGISKVKGEEQISMVEYGSTSQAYYPLPTDVSPPDHSRDPDQPPMPPSWRRNDQEPFLGSQTWGWFESATWHYGSNGLGAGRGEFRVKPLTCGFMTFYDPIYQQQQLARASTEREKLNLTVDGLWRGPGKEASRKLGLEQLMRRRRYHLLRNISDVDALRMNTGAERVLKNLDFDSSRFDFSENSKCSGIDWVAVTSDIVQRYALRLQQLIFVFNAGSSVDVSNSTAVRRWFSGLRQHTHFLLMPYFEYTAVADTGSDNYELSPSSENGQLALSRCQYQYTRLLASDHNPDKLTPEEALLTSAVEETLENICSWVVNVGLAVEREWFDRFDRRRSLKVGSVDDSTLVLSPTDFIRVNEWRASLEELMAWLGWVDQWTYCKNGCGRDEVCFIPMWPMDSIDRPGGRFGPGRGRGHDYNRRPGRYPDDGDKNMTHTGPLRRPPFWFVNEDSLWEPKCIKTEYAI